MAATVVEFHPRAAAWNETSRELDGKAAAMELLLGLRAGRVPLFDADGVLTGWAPDARLCLCSEGRDLLKSVDCYLAYRYQSLIRLLGRQIMGVKL